MRHPLEYRSQKDEPPPESMGERVLAILVAVCMISFALLLVTLLASTFF